MAHGPGFDVIRQDQLENQFWIKYGYSLSSIALNLPGILSTHAHPNNALELRIHDATLYYRRLESVISQYLSGNVTVTQAQQMLFDSWEEETNSYGRQKILSQYRKSLKILDLVVDDPKTILVADTKTIIIVGVVVPGVTIILCIVGIVIGIRRNRRLLLAERQWLINPDDVSLGPVIGAGGFGVVFKCKILSEET